MQMEILLSASNISDILTLQGVRFQFDRTYGSLMLLLELGNQL